MQKAIAEFVRGGGRLILDTDGYLGDVTIGERTFKFEPCELTELMPKQPLISCPFTRGVQPELRPEDEAFTFHQFGKGKVLACDSPKPAEMKQWGAWLGIGQRYDFKLWSQIIRWIVFGDDALPITVDDPAFCNQPIQGSQSLAPSIDAGSEQQVKLKLERWGKPKEALLHCYLESERGERWSSAQKAIRFGGNNTLIETTNLTVPEFAHGSAKLKVYVTSKDGKQLFHDVETVVSIQSALSLNVQVEKDGYPPEQRLRELTQ